MTLVHYRVQRGDTLDGIADRFDVTVERIEALEPHRGKSAPRGARLRIYAGGEPDGGRALKIARKTMRRAGQICRKTSLSGRPSKACQLRTACGPGETLYSIAKEYQITVAAIVGAN